MKLTPAEIGLLKEAVRWHRSLGGTFFQWRPGVGFGAFSEWKRWDGPYGPNQRQINISWEYASDPPRLLAAKNYKRDYFVELPVTTVTQAIDVLAALGYLPARFSSAYREGWNASLAYFSSHPRFHEEKQRLFDGDASIGFPAAMR